MRHYKVTFIGREGAARRESFAVSGLVNAYAPARAFLLVTNGMVPSRASLDALKRGEQTAFGLREFGAVTVERID